ncbi:Gfo/Idh/MocA family oxidoreductase [Pseudarthrobacter sp. J75]|uniref:Gfo/Idh/MocA family protein n=1 Tax=unclassified Pseudarthrobacter TaxID=2647000 RepID=UPI002E804675|nr:MULTISPECIES: Gfo/Idh/MocA family oxidoreductase [unclassified Pseudarthrobacter]MEE2523246.1 Gfo/Idh/MocA family oxidoreductase [Pseudarthrobacter sp. J47]MEE2527501.1 Gfo/Idh/MocA family oxidoreductase [Pseudarthrobacter sp. J75]
MVISALPASLVPDSMDVPALRWGIMGPGWIAERFTESVQAHSRQVIAAVGSRSLDRSKAFAEAYGVPAAYGSYEELAAAPDVDIVYVCTPHNVHHHAALLAIAAGKHVLIEKPIGLNAEQAREIAGRAGAAGVFASEAMWSFFLPKFDVIRQVLDAGTLGTVTTVLAEYGEYFERTHRIFDEALAGGPLLDLGTYPLALITEVLGAPRNVHAIGQPHESGVNAQLSAVMGFDGGAQAVMNTHLHNFTPTAATIVGTEATLSIDGPFNMPGGFEVRFPDGRRLRYDEQAGGHFEGLHYEAAAVARAIAAGQAETTQRPLAASIRTMAVADRIRQQLGITFPGETLPSKTAPSEDFPGRVNQPA